MKIKKLTWSLLIVLLTLIYRVEALTVTTIDWEYRWDIVRNWNTIVGKYSKSVFDIIKVVNSYLWFGIWVVCFIFMIINGYKLITAHWDEKQTKAATSALFKSIIWIAICLLSYIIVNLAVKIFA